MYRKFLVVILIITIGITVLVGCSKSVEFFTGNEKETQKYRTSNTVYLPMEKVKTLNPIISKDEDTYFINNLIFQGLFSLDENLNVENDLVEMYKYSSDGMTLELYLKNNMYFSNGNSLTASDVKFTIDNYKKAGNSSLYYSYVNRISSTKVDKGDYLKITLYFNDKKDVSLENLIFPIISAKQFKSTNDALKTKKDFVPIGSGAYKIESYNELSELVLVANDRFSGEKAKNELVFNLVPSKTEAINLIEGGSISVGFATAIDRETMLLNKNLTIENFPSNELEFLGFNFQNPHLSKKVIRNVIISTISNTEIIDGAYYKNGVISDNIYFPNFLGVPSTASKNKGDGASLLELLTQAGYQDLDGDSVVEDAEGEDMSFDILVNDNDSSRMTAAQVIKGGLDKLPIRTQIVAVDWETYQSRIASGDFDMYLGGYKINETYDMRFMLHSQYNNPIKYKNENLDKLLDEMKSGLSSKERIATFTEIKKILNDENPYYCILYKTYGALLSSNFEGILNPVFNNYYNHTIDWSCKYVVVEESSKTTQNE